MASGLRNGLAGNEQTRAQKMSPLNRFDQAVIRTGRIAHGGVAPPQHALQNVLGLGRDEGGRCHRELQKIRHRRGDMHMGIDQARQDGSALQINGPRVIHAGGTKQHIGNPVALDHHRGVGLHPSRKAVKQQTVREGCAHEEAPELWLPGVRILGIASMSRRR